MVKSLRTVYFTQLFILELPVAEFGGDVNVHGVDLLGQPLLEHPLLLGIERHLLQAEIVFVERRDMRGNDLHQFDDLGQLVAHDVLGQECRRNLARFEADQGIVVVKCTEVREILTQELRHGELRLEGIETLQNVVVRDDTAVHLRRGVVGELEGGLVEREGILAYLVGDAVQEHDPFVELVHRIDRAQQDMAEW